MSPDVMAKLSLYPTELNGRESPTPSSRFSFIIDLNDNFHDARAYLEGCGSISPGQQAEVPIKFLDPDTVLPKLQVGDQIPIWEGREIGQLQIIQIPSRS